MPETKVSARDYILLADIDGNATFKPVACLTSNSLTSTVNTIDATSKCGDEFQPGPSFTQSFQCAARTVFAMKMGKATPTTGDITYSGSVWISNFDVNADDKDDVKFSATFVVYAPPVTQTEQ
jgi:hypothetical protein